jgi:putative ABC transport system substrate-binding protein
MRLIGLAVVVALSLTLAPLTAEAQPVGRTYRLGILMTDRDPAFEQELKSLGYVEGQNLIVLRRYTYGSLEALDDLARELVGLRPDVIAVSNGEMARTVRRATKTIPIVVAASGDLEAQRLVTSLAKPGGNVTGLQTMSTDLAAKRLELLQEIVPALKRFAVIVPWPGTTSLQQRETERAAQAMGIRMDILRAADMNGLVDAFNTLRRNRYDGLIVFANSCSHSQRVTIADTARANRLPAVYEAREFVAAGGLVSVWPKRTGSLSALRAVCRQDP